MRLECFVLFFLLLLFYFILYITHPEKHYNDRSLVTRYKNCHHVISYSEYCSGNICIYDIYLPTRFSLYGSKNNNIILFIIYFFLYSSGESSKIRLVQLGTKILKNLDQTTPITLMYNMAKL